MNKLFVLLPLWGLSLASFLFGEEVTLNEAIGLTLYNQKEIQISILNIKSQEGVYQQSGGPFDLILNNATFYSQTHDTECAPLPCMSYNTHSINTESDVTKTARIGTSVSLRAMYRRYSAHSTAREVSFQIDQPLLRNFYYGLNRQIEEANRLELDAVQYDTLFFISQKILNTVNNYWNAVATQERLGALQFSIERLEDVYRKIDELVKENELARNDKNQPAATLATIKQQAFNEEYAMYSAKQNLLLAMGEIDESTCSHFERGIDVIAGLPFLPIDKRLREYKDSLIRQAFFMRYDVLASETRQLEKAALVKGAKNQTLPELTLFGNVTRHNDQVKALEVPCTSQDFAGNNNFTCRDTEWRIGVNFSVPFYNDAAVGFLKQQEAILSQTKLQTQVLKQTIIVSILNQVSLLIALEKEILEAQDAVDLYNLLFENEASKLAAGFGSIFEMLDYETRRIDSLLSLINLRLTYFQGIANLHYLTGSLIVGEDPNGVVSFEDVTKLPLP